MNVRLLVSAGFLTAAALAQTPLLIDQPVTMAGPPLPGSVGIGWQSDLDGPFPVGTPQINWWRLADGFKTAVPGEQLVTNFSIWGAWGGAGPAPTTTDTFEVSFREDSTFPLGATVFGAVPHYEAVVTFTGLAPTSVTATGSSIAMFVSGAWTTFPLYKLDFDLPLFPTPVSVTPNCYDNWITVASENSPNHLFGWAQGAASANGNSNSKCAGRSSTSSGWANNLFAGATNFALQIGAVPSGLPTLCVPELISDATLTNVVTTSLANATPNSVTAWAVAFGSSPIPTPWGILLLDPGFALLDPPFFTDGSGNATSTLGVPPGFSASGVPLWFQGIDLGVLGAGPLTLTNGVKKLLH